MISVLIDAAMRSLVVGLMVAAGMWAFRIRNVVTRKTALSLVLFGALAMPLLMQVTDGFKVLPAGASIVMPLHPMTLLEELQAKLKAKSESGSVTQHIPDPLHAPVPPQADKSAGPLPVAAPAPQAKISGAKDSGGQSNNKAAPMRQETMMVSAARVQTKRLAHWAGRPSFSLWSLALSIYVGVAAVLLLRLVLGLAVTLRLWLNASRIETEDLHEIPTGLRLRASARVSSPLTIGSAVLLPADYEAWDPEKFRIVLAHERSHIRQFDFYLQALAGLYAALVWFSPLGWWLKRELADLAEAISDRAGIEEARSRTSYAQILLEFAAAPRPAALGVAMARPCSLSRRIERLLNEHAFRQSFAEGRRTLFAFVLVPVVLFSLTAMVRVQAAAAQSARIAWIAPAAHSAPSLQVSQDVGPGEEIVADEAEAEALPLGSGPDAEASDLASPEAETATINGTEIAMGQAAPNLFPLPAMPRAVAVQEESGKETGNSMSFDRTLTVSGEAQLFVSTGSGDIRLTRSAGSQIRIHGKIHVSHHGSEDQARQIAANPPIEQNGNVIRVGQQRDHDHEHWRGISINYEIEAPAGTILAATSGSGDVIDEGVGKNAKLQTGSGDIRAKGLEGPFEVQTGSGNITAEGTGPGDVRAQTGSGDIEIKDIHGSFNAQTGSGNIKATGTPSAPWTLRTGSGDVEIWTGNAPMSLEASTGSGSVSSEHEMLVKGSVNNHHITANLSGGGPLVRAETGSGDVRIH
jgi:beta-lactamase regulating signal transducer with metallopeptidase domain